MAMGTRKQREKQEGLWIAQQELASAPGHPFYQKLNELLEAERFGEFVESRCAKFYAERNGRPSLTPWMRKSRQVRWPNNRPQTARSALRLTFLAQTAFRSVSKGKRCLKSSTGLLARILSFRAPVAILISKSSISSGFILALRSSVRARLRCRTAEEFSSAILSQ